MRLLNDLSAIAHAVPNLRAQDLETINPGRPTACASLEGRTFTAQAVTQALEQEVDELIDFSG